MEVWTGKEKVYDDKEETKKIENDSGKPQKKTKKKGKKQKSTVTPQYSIDYHDIKKPMS